MPQAAPARASPLRSSVWANVLTRVRMAGSTSRNRDRCSVAQNQPRLNRKRGATAHAEIANPELLCRAAGQRRRGRVGGILTRAAAVLRAGADFGAVLVGTRRPSTKT